MSILTFRHLEKVPSAQIPVLPIDAFRRAVLDAVAEGDRLVAFHGTPQSDDVLRLVAVLAHDRDGELRAVATDPGESYPALAPECPQAAGFEREIAEQWGVKPLGHPWLKPLRFHRSYRPGHDAWGRSGDASPVPSAMEYFRVEGEGIHEVAVGPVHAGIIEPGHFRFQCHGEQVLHLEISLGYQHRGVERALIGGPYPRTIHHMETLAGDTTIGHALAYCEAVETLAGCRVPARAQVLRGLNHFTILNALADPKNDVHRIALNLLRF